MMIKKTVIENLKQIITTNTNKQILILLDR